MKQDSSDLGGRTTEWGNVSMLYIILCFALGYLFYCLCALFRRKHA